MPELSPIEWILRTLVALLALLMLATLFVAFRPLSLGRLAANAHPIPETSWESYRAQREAADRDPSLLSDCQSIFYPGAPDTHDAVILFHGLTNCPEQFRELGRFINHETGASVLIPRLPYHGEQDRLTENLAKLTAEDLVQEALNAFYAAQQIPTNDGLPPRIDVMGLSLGGTMAAWMAQELPVRRAVIIAPVLGIPDTSPRLTRPLTSALLLLPNRFHWWDEELQATLPGPHYAYPRFPSHAAAHTLRLGLRVLEQSGRSQPEADSMVIVSNDSDLAANRPATDHLIANWEATVPDQTTTYTFPAEFALNHDVVDPNNPSAKTNIVYPVLIDLLTRTR